ncbi:MAG TPA: DUF6799 domain-containing protein [Hanamia sp.]|nr:DUF6799 domain-containing protein [Hanamia sp.]
MKKLLLSAFAIALSSGVFAQDTQSQNKWKDHEGIFMKNGKMMVIRNGQKTQLLQDTTFSNGTTIMVDGTVKSSDGTTTMLKDGQFVNSDGTISNKKWKKDDDDKMSPEVRDTLK